MFTEKLGLDRPQDVFARMEQINGDGEIVYERLPDGEEGAPGWLEFWGPEMAAVKNFGRHVAAEEMLREKQEQRKGGKKPTMAEMERLIDDYELKAVEGLAIRLKAWRLVDKDGAVIDTEATKEKATQLFGHPGYSYLRTAALEFVGDPLNFFTKKSANLSNSADA